MSFIFERLEVYRRAVNFADEINTTCDSFSGGSISSLTDQLRRAAISIPLNIAEGNGRWHHSDKRQFFLIARGSAFECVPLIELCKRRDLISAEKESRLRSEIKEIAKMISGLIRRENTG